MQKSLFEPLSFASGQTMKNRFFLAPMTNTQSHDDGCLSQEEYHWLTLRAKGGFGMTMTCACHVQANGQGFPGQLGIFDDKHLEGHLRLVSGIQAHQSLAVIQLHHAGIRSPKELIKMVKACTGVTTKKTYKLDQHKMFIINKGSERVPSYRIFKTPDGMAVGAESMGSLQVMP